jgi:glucose-1-phosphate cytidylyltransferase
MKTVILCGGKGMRLSEITESIPKPLVKIGGKPILWHIMKVYAAQGFTDFVLALGYKGGLIEKYFQENPEGWNIEFAHTGEETNTGGRIKKMEKYVGGGGFMATYGDGVANIKLRELLQHHEKNRTTATITCVRPASRFGIVEITPEGKITGFREKPVLPFWVNGGFFAFRNDVFDAIGSNDVLETDVFPRLAADGKMAAYRFDGFWDCMDTFKDMQTLNEAWNNGKAKWKVWA